MKFLPLAVLSLAGHSLANQTTTADVELKTFATKSVKCHTNLVGGSSNLAPTGL